MKNKLTVENLNASYYDNGLHELEFKLDGKTVFVRNIKLDEEPDEFYWDDEENVSKAVEAASEEDIEVEEKEMEKLNVLKEFGYTSEDVADFSKALEEIGSFEFEAEMQSWDMVEALQYAGFEVETEDLGDDNYTVKVSE